MRIALVALCLAVVACDSDKPPTQRPTPSVPPFQSTAGGAISGIVRLRGVLKPLRSEQPENATCGGKPVDRARLRTVILGEGQTLANVYVAVKSGLGNRHFPTPTHPVILREVDCAYEPRVFGVLTRQALKVRNEDDTMHYVDVDTGFGKGQATKGDEETFQFVKPEVGKIIRCDVHPWMIGWVHVSDHPFFAVTGIDGEYSIKELPPGEYEILAWHERFLKAPLVAKVIVPPGGTAKLDFTFEAPTK